MEVIKKVNTINNLNNKGNIVCNCLKIDIPEENM